MRKEITYELVGKALQSEKVKAELIKTLYVELNKFIFFRLKVSKIDAEDLTSEVVVKIITNLHKFQPTNKFFTWAFSIAKNHVIDFKRKQKMEFQSLNFKNQDDEEQETQISSSDNIETINAQQEVQKIVSDILNSDILPDKLKTIFELKFIHDFPYEEIAKKTNTPLGTIKAKIHVIRKTLQKHQTIKHINFF